MGPELNRIRWEGTIVLFRVGVPAMKDSWIQYATAVLVALAFSGCMDSGTSDGDNAAVPGEELGVVAESDVEPIAEPAEREPFKLPEGVIMSDLSVVFETSKGTINVELYPEKTPVTVASFVNLAQQGYYDGLSFHRVIPDFMIQGGCPQGTGTGGPGYTFEDECDTGLVHDAPGKLSMANAGPATNGSQFFITHVETPWLDGKHAIFGAVKSADDQAVVDAIEGGDSMVKVTVEGDASALLESLSDRVAEWNAAIGK